MAETKPTLESEIDEIAKGLGRASPAWKNEATPPKTPPPPKAPLTIVERIQRIRDEIADLDKALAGVRVDLDSAVANLHSTIGDR